MYRMIQWKNSLDLEISREEKKKYFETLSINFILLTINEIIR